jgi:hypothetical protein
MLFFILHKHAGLFKQFDKMCLLHKIAPIANQAEEKNKMSILLWLFLPFFPRKTCLLMSLVLIKLYKRARITVTSRILFERA